MTSARRWGLAAVLALAPLLALGACDQISDMAANLGRKDSGGPAPLASVAVDARAVAGRLLPEDMRAQTLTPDPVLYVPGEVLVGARVQDKVIELAPPSMAAALRAQFAAGGPPQPIDPDLERRATEAAVAEATKGARVVLDRLGVDAIVNASAGGVLKIDLDPQKASPLQLPDAGSAAPGDPAKPVAPTTPALAVEDGAVCPKGVTQAALDADLVLKTQCAIDRLKAARAFDYVEKNYVIAIGAGESAVLSGAAPATSSLETSAPPGLPDDPLLPFQWDLRARGDGADQSPGGAGFSAFWLKAGQTGSRAVRVAVIDSGIDRSHPDFTASPNIAPGIDLISDPVRGGDGDGVDADPNDAGDGCAARGVANTFHGSHVAGTIGAAVTNDRKGVAGAAWNVTIVPIRAIGQCGGELEDIVAALRWAAGLAPAQLANGQVLMNQMPADVINMSISVGIPCPQSLQAAIDDVVAHGAVVVVAAGNKALPAKYYAPGNCANVINVAAGDQNGNLAYYSNFGPEVRVLAPGGDVFTDSDGDGRPDGILSTRTTAADCFDPQTGQPAPACYYSYLQGTSMAAPHVTAALALLKAQLNVSGRQLEEALLTRALSPIEPTRCAVACDKDKADGPISGAPGQCLRQCGRGMLDLARAANQP